MELKSSLLFFSIFSVNFVYSNNEMLLIFGMHLISEKGINPVRLGEFI